MPGSTNLRVTLRGYGHHLRGWQAGVVCLLAAVITLPLAIARPADPGPNLPLPAIDWRGLEESLSHDRLRAARLGPRLARDLSTDTGEAPLFALRRFAEAYRAFGRAEATGNDNDRLRARRPLLDAFAQAQSLGSELLLDLRAYECRLFIDAVAAWAATGTAPNDLIDLGGSFVGFVERRGLLDDDGTIALGEAMLAVLFKRRWAEISGADPGTFGLDGNELRAFYAFLLTHPWSDLSPSQPPEAACQGADRFRLRKVEELSKVDPAYPRLFARGILFLRLGAYPDAAQAFRDHLASGRDSPYALRALNYLLLANLRAS